MKNIEFSFGEYARVVLIGPDSQIPDLRKMAGWHGADEKKVCLIKPPNNCAEPGYQTIATTTVYGMSRDPAERDIFAEGVILNEKKSAAVIRSADCPTLVLFEKNTGRLLVAHAGRAAMTPTNVAGKPIRNIVTKAYAAVTRDCAQPFLLAYITGGISSEYFPHQDMVGQKLIAPFKQFGSIAIQDQKRGTLDLPSLIRWQLLQLGVSPNRIWYDKTCTHQTPWLASYRRDKDDRRNVVIAVKRT